MTDTTTFLGKCTNGGYKPELTIGMDYQFELGMYILGGPDSESKRPLRIAKIEELSGVSILNESVDGGTLVVSVQNITPQLFLSLANEGQSGPFLLTTSPGK